MADVFSKLEGLQRRRALLEQLQKQSLESPIQGDTGVGQLLAKLGTAWLQREAGSDLDQESGALSGEYRQGLASEAQRFMQTQQGQPGQYELPPGMPGPQVPPTQADPRAAVIQAMTSRYPEMQGVGQMGFQELLARKPPEQLKPMVVGAGGAVFDPTKGAEVFRNPKEPEDQWGEPYEVRGDLYQKNAKTGQIRKLDNAPNISVSATANAKLPPQEREFDKTFGRKQAEVLSEQLANRQSGIDGINAATKGLTLLQQGIYTGAFAEYKKAGAKGLAALGLNDGEKAARTEEFVSYIGDIVIPSLKAFGGNDTVEEMRYLQKVSAGDITMEPQALQRVLTSIEAKFRRKLGETDTMTGRWTGSGKTGVPTVPPVTPLPPPSGGSSAPAAPAPAGAPSAKPMSLEEYLKSKRGK